jgi:hypothetical protein
VPAREIRAADILDFALADELVECGEGFLDGRVEILTMKLQQVDRVDPQPLQ